jgi:hypothetical protein
MFKKIFIAVFSYLIAPWLAMVLYIGFAFVQAAVGYFFVILIMLCPFVRLAEYLYNRHKRKSIGRWYHG